MCTGQIQHPDAPRTIYIGVVSRGQRSIWDTVCSFFCVPVEEFLFLNECLIGFVSLLLSF